MKLCKEAYFIYSIVTLEKKVSISKVLWNLYFDCVMQMGCGHNRQLLPGLSSKSKLSHCQNFKEANVFQIQAQSNFTASWSIKLGPSGSLHCNKSGALSILWAFPDCYFCASIPDIPFLGTQVPGINQLKKVTHLL